MSSRLFTASLALLISSSSFTSTDRVWVIGVEGDPDDRVTVKVRIRYEGSGLGDSISAFDIPLIWDATVCSVEAIGLGWRFRESGWMNVSQVDNEGIMGSPSVPKLTLSACVSDTGQYVDRGTWSAGIIEFRILESVSPPESTCIDTLMAAFSPLVYLGFKDKYGDHVSVSLLSFGCVRCYGFTDSVWIVGADGYPGDLCGVEVWLQYKGYGSGDEISYFNIPLTYDATVCTAEAITIGSEFCTGWKDESKIDNQGAEGPPAVPKILVSAWTGPCISHNPRPRGTHLAATIDFRILDTVVGPDSTCLDTLMQASSPFGQLRFGNDYQDIFIPSFSSDYIRVLEYPCGDCNADGRVTIADALYLKNYYYQTPPGSPAPIGEADTNVDGRVTLADALYLKNYYYQTPPGSPAPCEPPLTTPSFGEKRREK